jgi:hypothetical protein
LLNAINVIEAWGLLNQNIWTKKKSAQSIGVLHEKNWRKKTPLSFLHEQRWGGGFSKISVNQIGDFEK